MLAKYTLIVCLGALVSSLTGCSSQTAVALAPLAFSDNFDTGYDNWQLSGAGDGPVKEANDGANKFVTLDSTNSEFTRLKTNLDGALFTEVDLSASMKFRIEQLPSASRAVRLDLRQASSTENIFYAVGATINTDGLITKVSIFKKVLDQTEGYTICSLAEGTLTSPVAASQWQTIALVIRGTSKVTLAAYLDDTQTASYVDDCVMSLTSTAGSTVSNGGCLTDQTALGIQVERGIIASVDDILVFSL
jgi:hypothetical protein